MEEFREGFARAGGVLNGDPGSPIAQEVIRTQDAKAHRHAMVFIRVNLDESFGRRSAEGRAVRVDGERGKFIVGAELRRGWHDFNPEAFQFRRHGKDAVGLLLPRVSDVADGRWRRS